MHSGQSWSSGMFLNHYAFSISPPALGKVPFNKLNKVSEFSPRHADPPLPPPLSERPFFLKIQYMS